VPAAAQPAVSTSEYKAPSLFLAPASADVAAPSEYKAPSLFMQAPPPPTVPEYRAPTLLLGLSSKSSERQSAHQHSTHEVESPIDSNASPPAHTMHDRPTSSSSFDDSDEGAESYDGIGSLNFVPVSGTHGRASMPAATSHSPALSGEGDPDDEIDWMAEGFWYSDMATAAELEGASSVEGKATASGSDTSPRAGGR